MRSAWIEKRRGQANVTQLHYARQGLVTEEMAHVAKRENLPESLVMEVLVARLSRLGGGADTRRR